MKHLLVLGGLLVGGCGWNTGRYADYPPCVDDSWCRDGRICVHEHAHDGNWDVCLLPWSSECATSGVCPDSPNGTACKRDDGSTASFCWDLPTKP